VPIRIPRFRRIVPRAKGGRKILKWIESGSSTRLELIELFYSLISIFQEEAKVYYKN